MTKPFKSTNLRSLRPAARSNPLDEPLTDEAKRLINDLRRRIDQKLTEIRRVPASVLLWGPGLRSPGHPLHGLRLQLRSLLRQEGHAAVLGEELCDPDSAHSLRMQQLAHIQECDMVVSLPSTPGSIAEIHDFAGDSRVSAKVLVFLNREHSDGYSPQSLLTFRNVSGWDLVYYPSECETNIVIQRTMQEAQLIRERKWMVGGRY